MRFNAHFDRFIAVLNRPWDLTLRTRSAEVDAAAAAAGDTGWLWEIFQ